MKTTLATIASVEARLPVQAQQILRQVSQGKKKSSKGALESRKGQLEPQSPLSKPGLHATFLPPQEIGCFTRKELRYFAQYLHWVGQTVGAHLCQSGGINLHPLQLGGILNLASPLLVPAEGGCGFVPASRHSP